MALLTQKAILSAFSQMLEEMPFDRITVSALVSAAVYSRRSGLISSEIRPLVFCICRYRNSERLAFTTRLTKRIISSLAYLS